MSEKPHADLVEEAAGMRRSPIPRRGASSQQLAEAEAKRDEYLADLQRLAADFDNYRKRALRDREAFAARAAERLVTRLIPVLDDLERALEAAEDHEEAKVLAGVEMTKSALAAALASRV